MKGIFRKKYSWNIIFLLCGLWLAGYFVFVGLKDSGAWLGSWLTGVVYGGVIVVFGVIFLFINFKAFLYIQDGRITGKYHYFGRICCDASDVAFVLAQYNTLSILLKNGKRHVITGLENPWLLAAEIRRQSFALETEQVDVLLGRLKAEQTARKRDLRLVIASFAVVFVNLFIAVFLTGGREMNQFTKLDWCLFAGMGVVELLTVVAIFYFAGQCGRHLLPVEHLKYRIKGACIAFEPLPPGNVKYVYTDENYAGRVVVCGFPNDGSVYFGVQEFVGDLQLETVHTSEIYASEELLFRETKLEDYQDISQYFQ